ncbi:MAG: hypothetical protein DRJ31_07015 [Candidatus Methanomethylicota archaeon]|uniref:PIN domain-containing protein n=1 Tax=Thermoproteota archaeon TaxID=2056631 RepID=A0A497ENB5_9CREN|nr:MAG: hypothetical protein DRJ31_07015 [Candidatus Verstraetearchaeota archaeon]
MKPTVVDVSVFVDYFVIVEGKEDRHRIAVEFLNRLSDRGAIVYGPFVFEIELCAVLVRYMEPNYVMKILEVVLNHVATIKENGPHSGAKPEYIYFIILYCYYASLTSLVGESFLPFCIRVFLGPRVAQRKSVRL